MSTVSNSPPERLRRPNKHHAAWLLRRIWDRVNVENEHFMGVIVGREGWGKSMTGIRLAKELDPSFTADRVLFEPVPLLERLRDGEHQQGQAYVLDESGVQLGSRTWHDRSQIMVNQAFQLIRDHNLILIMTLPRLGELDSQAQGRLHAAYEITEKKDGEFVRGKWKWFDPDRMDETGTIYKHYPKRRVNGTLIRCETFAFEPPEDEELLANYSDRKATFQEEFYEQTIQEIGGGDESQEYRDPKDIGQEILDDGIVEDYVGENNGVEYLDRDLISMDFDIGDNRAKKVKKFLQQQLERDLI